MKSYIRLIAMLLIAVFGLVSCAVPEGTPAQKARQTEANARVGNAVALGIGAALLGAAANKYADRSRPRYYYARPAPRVYYVPRTVYYY
jgi:hypothetical protein